MKLKVIVSILFVLFKIDCFSLPPIFFNDSLQLIIGKRVNEKDTSLTAKELNRACGYYSEKKDAQNLSLTYIHYGKFYLPENIDSSVTYYTKALSLINPSYNNPLKKALYYLHKDISNSLPDSIPLLLKLKNSFPENSILAGFINEKAGHKNYQSAPVKAIFYYNEAASIFKTNKDFVCAGYNLNNISFIYDEQLNDQVNALNYSKKGLDVWRSIKDTLNEANILKYQAVVYSKLKRFEEALTAGRLAVKKFSSKGDSIGLNVAFYDMAIAFKEMNSPDSAIVYVNKSNNFWRNIEWQKFRLFIGNTLLINIFNNQHKLELSKKFIDQNLAMESDNFYWRSRLDFYKNCKEFYIQNKENQTATAFQKKMDDLEMIQKK